MSVSQTFSQSQSLSKSILGHQSWKNKSDCKILICQDFVELPPDDMQKLLVHNTVSIINIKIARWLNEVSN